MPATHRRSLSSRDQQLIDLVCDQFESEWIAGKIPDLGAYADRLPRALQRAGLPELVILDAHYRRGRQHDTSSRGGTPLAAGETQIEMSSAGSPADGPSLSWQHYLERFPILQDQSPPAELHDPRLSQEKIDGRFQPLRIHAAGGLGQVSMAQDTQIGRTVAIKEMHHRFATSNEHRQRFLREAAITGQLEHPGIVPVYTLGSRDNGEPYYSMRLVRGRSLLQAIHDLRVNCSTGIERRKLVHRFLDVCHAVDYAHSRDVIHRDIKPENIMLGDYGETLLVDWGLAKRLGDGDELAAADEPTSADSTETQMGTVLGTPCYMSPEQSLGDPQQVGKSSDIYSLGATMFHLLTGEAPLPFPSGSASAAESNRRTLSSVAEVPRPFQAICNKAMAEQPDQRYASASELASDIELALADQPIAVYHDPPFTRMRRWIQKHRAASAASLAAICLVFIGLIIISWITGNYANQLLAKNRQLDEMVRRETGLRLAAEQSEKRSTDALDFLVQALRSPDPNRDGREIKIVDVLDQAEDQIDEDFGNDPLMRGRMLSAIGDTYMGLGLFGKAQSLLQSAFENHQQHFGHSHRSSLKAGAALAWAKHQLNDPESLTLIEVQRQIARKSLGESDADTLYFEELRAVMRAHNGDAEESVPILEDLLDRAVKTHGTGSRVVQRLMNNLGSAYYYDGQMAKSLEIARSTYELRLSEFGPRALKTITAGNNYAAALIRTSKPDQAITLLERLLESARQHLGNDHVTTLITIDRLGGCYLNQGLRDRAESLITEGFERSKERYGENHPRTLNSGSNLGRLYLESGDYVKAAQMFEMLLGQWKMIRSNHDSDYLTVANNLASVYRLDQKYQKAIDLFHTTIDAQRQHLGDHHPNTIRSILNLAATYQQADRFEESLPCAEQAVELAQTHLGLDHRQTQSAQSVLGTSYLQLGQYDKALPVLLDCHQTRSRTMQNHWLRYYVMTMLGEANLGLGQVDQAEALLAQADPQLRQLASRIPARAQGRVQEARKRIAQLYESQNMPYRAAKFREPLDQ